jgi:hypothetical protein
MKNATKTIKIGLAMRNMINDLLGDYLSPEQIPARLKLDGE